MNEEKKDSTLGNNVRIARAAKNLSQAELAAKAKLTQSYISRVESGYVPSQEALVAIAEALGTTPQALRTIPELIKDLTLPREKPRAESFAPDEEQDMEEAQTLL